MTKDDMRLGVNIDHVATVREARKTFEPDPQQAAIDAQKAGCDGIVCHLRKDRRHINEEDCLNLKKIIHTHLNLEMSVDPEIVDIACKLKPDQATIVPENRQEITTEGGLDVVANLSAVKKTVQILHNSGVEVSLFIDPDNDQVDAAKDADVSIIEFHTGCFAESFNTGADYEKELSILKGCTEYALGKGLTVCAGHGLTYDNVVHVAQIDGIHELNIGHSIISKSIFTGIYEAVIQMKGLLP